MSNFVREDIRNIAIIAHVDHGKTTLVDALLKQSNIFRTNEKVQERVMDSNDLEKERGITILSKNTAVHYGDKKINIIDTPGHADFGGEVERVLKMVDSVILVVDSYEGPMPQTKFVLRKALELGATDEQLDFPIAYASAREGIATVDLENPKDNMKDLFELIISHVPAPVGDKEAGLQMLVTTLDSSEYVGKIAIGRIERGVAKRNQQAAIVRENGDITRFKISSIYTYNGLKREEVEEATIGDIVAISGIEDVNIGETITDAANPEALPFVKIDEPTLSMNFMVNNSPFAGKEGEFITSRHLRDRLMKELETNVSLKVVEITPECFEVSGRGELHLSILIETMRREGFELQVSKPNVIFKEIDGVKVEPMEHLTIDVPEEFMGPVMEKLGPRKGEMVNMTSAVNGYSRLEFKIPARGLIGFRNEFMTDTKGNGIMNHVFDGYEKVKGDMPARSRGSIIAFESGTAVAYGLFNAQDRGTLFIGAGTEVYAGMVVGECSRAEDLEVNICKKKQLTNTRASGSDDALKLVPHREMSLEQCLEFIAHDELVEVTPVSVRMRKRILDSNERKRASRK